MTESRRPRRPSKSSRLFDQWIDWLGSATFLAKKLHVSNATISQLRRGERKPSRRLASIIERLSRRAAPNPILAVEWQ